MKEHTGHGDAERGWDHQITMWPHWQQLSTEGALHRYTDCLNAFYIIIMMLTFAMHNTISPRTLYYTEINARDHLDVTVSRLLSTSRDHNPCCWMTLQLQQLAADLCLLPSANPIRTDEFKSLALGYTDHTVVSYI